MRQALCGALYEEVTDFYRLIAVLEGQLNVPTPLPGAVGVWLCGCRTCVESSGCGRGRVCVYVMTRCCQFYTTACGRME